MPDKDVNINVNANGTGKAKQELDETAKTTKQFGDTTADANTKASEGAEKTTQKMSNMTRVVSSLKTAFLGFFGATAAISAVTRAIKAQSEAVKEHSEIVLAQQNKLLRLQFLGDFYAEKPELRKEVMELAEFGKRPTEQVADAWYNLKSKGAGLSDSQQKKLLMEALEYGRTDPSAPLDTLVDMFSLYAKQSGQTDANKVQNVIKQTVTEAGGSTGQVAQYMPQFLPVGMSGGLSPEETAGLWSYVTTQFAEPAIATTGLRSVFMAMQGKGTPDSQKTLKQLGVSGDMNFFDKIQALSTSDMSLTQAEAIAQKEGAATLLSLIQNPDAMMQTVGSVVAAGQSDRDLTKESIDNLFGSDEMARMEETDRLLELQIENIKGSDTHAVKLEVGKKLREKKLRESGQSEWAVKYDRWVNDIMSGLGFTATHEERDVPFINNETGDVDKSHPININNDNSIHYHPAVGEVDVTRSSLDE